MSFVIPKTTSLVIDAGSRFVKIGYAGDHHPFVVHDTTQSHNTVDSIVKYIEKYSKEFDVDSFIVIESQKQNLESRKKIVQQVFVKRLCESVLFLRSPLCDAFGHGKISCTVLGCSASTLSASVILNGKIVESIFHPKGSLFLEEDILREVEKLNVKTELGLPTGNLPRLILESEDLIRRIEDEYKIDVFKSVKDEVFSLIDNIIEMRNKYNINKKNVANGCIILSGGMFKYKPFFAMAKMQLTGKLGEDFSDFILRDNNLDCTFFGASLVGSNDCSKTLFISSYDFQKSGMDAVKFKSIDAVE